MTAPVSDRNAVVVGPGGLNSVDSLDGASRSGRKVIGEAAITISVVGVGFAVIFR